MSDETFRVHDDAPRPDRASAPGSGNAAAGGRWSPPPPRADDTSDDLLSAFNAIRRTLDAVRDRYDAPADPSHTGEIPRILADEDDSPQGPDRLPKRRADARPDAVRAAPANPVFLYAPPSDEPPAAFLPKKSASRAKSGRPPFAKPPFATMTDPVEPPPAAPAESTWQPAAAPSANGATAQAAAGYVSAFEPVTKSSTGRRGPAGPDAAAAPDPAAPTTSPAAGTGTGHKAKRRAAKEGSAAHGTHAAAHGAGHPGSHAAPGAERRGPRRLVLVIAVIVVIALIVAVVLVISANHKSADPSAAATPSLSAVQHAADEDAAHWVQANVGTAHVVACDSTVCAMLGSLGFTASALVPVQSGAQEVEQADTVVVTPALRAAAGAQLSDVIANEPLAVFGTGADQVEVAAVALNGPTSYAEALGNDRQAARLAGAALLADHNLTFSTQASTQLSAGLVDARLCTLLSTLAASHKLAISGFTPTGPGAGPDVPSAGVVITSVDNTAPGAGTAQTTALLTMVNAQQAPYLPMSAQPGQDGTGAPILTITFAQPGPTGLLSTAPPTHSAAPTHSTAPTKKAATKKSK